MSKQLMTKTYINCIKLCLKLLSKHNKLNHERCNKQAVNLHKDCVLVMSWIVLSHGPGPSLGSDAGPGNEFFLGLGLILVPARENHGPFTQCQWLRQGQNW